MRLKLVLVLLVAMAMLGIASAANALEPNDPKPPVQWGMNENQTKYI